MNQLRQDINDFHKQIKPTLEKVLGQYDGKTTQKIYNAIVKPCKKLIQKCSFKSLSDAGSLCSLAYWLYIYEHKALAFAICEHTHGVDFAYEYWSSGYIDMQGLEIRIARELLGENRKSNIPPHLVGFYFSKSIQKQLRYPHILRKEEIVACTERFFHTQLLGALYNVIGKGETGLYGELNRNWAAIEKTIAEYIDYLKMVDGEVM